MKGWESVLAGLRELEPDLINEHKLLKAVPHVDGEAKPGRVLALASGAPYVSLDGYEFTSLQLRAIAAWMDEPAAVAATYGEDVARRAVR